MHQNAFQPSAIPSSLVEESPEQTNHRKKPEHFRYRYASLNAAGNASMVSLYPYPYPAIFPNHPSSHRSVIARSCSILELVFADCEGNEV